MTVLLRTKVPLLLKASRYLNRMQYQELQDYQQSKEGATSQIHMLPKLDIFTLNECFQLFNLWFI